MAELLKTKRIGSELEELIFNAKKYIFIFSYSLKIDSIYMERLRAASNRGVDITFVFGVEPKETAVIKELNKIKGCRVFYKQFMHAKFYYNEETLIVASMNLSEVSEAKNYELGVLFKIDKNPDAFRKIEVEASQIISNADLWPGTKEIKKDNGLSLPFSNEDREPIGVCIRCGKKVSYNPHEPFCKGCHDKWLDWENDFHPEKFCHSCGKPGGGTSHARPECYSCYSNFS